MRSLPAATLALLVAVLAGCGSDDAAPPAGAATAGAAASATTPAGDPALTAQLLDAAIEGEHDRVKELLAQGAVPDESVATTLVFGDRDDPTLIEALFAAGLDKDYASDAAPGHSVLMWAAEAGHIRMVEAVLDAGADIDKLDLYGDPAVSVAAFHGELDVVKLLVERGAKLDFRGYLDRTALGHARAQGHDEVADYLAGKGAPE